MNINQARDILDKVLANLQMTRQDHAVLQQALQLLYAKAKDNQDDLGVKQEYGLEEDNVGANGKIIPIRPTS
jgi:hypothetical protein